MTPLIMSFGSLLCVLGFVYVVSSHRVTERRKWVYYLAQQAIFCFVLGMLLEVDIVGVVIMISMMLCMRYAYHRTLRFSGTGRGLERGISRSAAPVASLDHRASMSPRYERMHDDIGSSPLSIQEEIVLAGIRQGLRGSFGL